MNILINALGADTGGALNHLRQMMTAIRHRNDKNHYWFLCRDQLTNLPEGNTIQLIRISKRLSRNAIYRLYVDNVLIGRIIKDYKIDRVVSLTNFGSWFHEVPHILFQRNALYFSDWYQKNLSLKASLENRLRSHFSFELMKRANVIVTPTQAMKTMILNTHPNLDENKFKVLLHGYEAPSSQVALPPKIEQLIQQTSARIFYPSLPAFHKGIFMIFSIARELKRRGKSFRIYLCFTEMEAKRYFGPQPIPKDWQSLCENIIFLGKLTRSDMDQFYTQMDLVLNPSLCESFGFPVLEAMGACLPLVCAELPVNREICGAASLYYPMLDPVQAADRVCEALEERVKLMLKTEAKKRLAGFDWSWKRYLDEFVEIVQTAH